MADDLRERKRERRKRRKKLQQTLQRLKEQRRARSPDTDSTPQANDSTEEKQQAKKIREEDITGLKYFDKLRPLLERLHEVGCERDKAGNRELHYDQYCMLILLYLFNPIVTSLRGIRQASELSKVQMKLGCSTAR